MSLIIAGLAAGFVAVYLYLGFLYTVLLSLGLVLVYALVFQSKWCFIAWKTAPRDLKALSCYVKILWLTRDLTKKNWMMPDIFHDTVQRHPDKECFLYQDQVWTFKEVEDFSLRVTAVLKAQGVGKGSIVGMLVNNCPQLPAIWLGSARLGGISPLINTNQRGNALIHSISVASCDVVIFSDEYQSAIEDIAKELDPSTKLFKLTHRALNPSAPAQPSAADSIVDFTALLECTPPALWTPAVGDGFHGKLLYIYTSGTTGLPKAAVISTSRMTFMAAGIHYLGGVRPSDTIYCPLPLYHTAGGVISVGQAFIFGCTVVIKPKFSASQYFPDCIKYKATLDAKKSPLALLAQTCSAIGADTPNPKLISAAEKASSKKYSEDKSPVVHSPVDNKPSFKPYESCLTSREKTRTPEDRASINAHSKTPQSSKGSAATTPILARCGSNLSSSSQRTPPPAHRKTPSEKSEERSSPAQGSPIPAKSNESSNSSSSKLPFTPTTLSNSDTKEPSSFKPSIPVSSAFLGGMPPNGFPLQMDFMTSSLMAAQHHALKNGLNPYLVYARMKAPGGELGVCRDPYCTGCSLSSHLMKSATCPAGCSQCDHTKTPFPMPGGHPAAAAYAHAQLAALAAASQLPYVCSWMAGDSAYCGKRFGTSEELLQHLRSHTASGEPSPSLSMLSATHPLLQRTYPTPPLSPLTPRFHPYSKPSHLVSSPPLPFPLAPHPSLAAYFPSYPLFGPRPLHP